MNRPHRLSRALFLSILAVLLMATAGMAAGRSGAFRSAGSETNLTQGDSSGTDECSAQDQGTQDEDWGDVAWFENPFYHREDRDDRVVLAADVLQAGLYRYEYVTRAVTPGRHVVPPTHAEEKCSSVAPSQSSSIPSQLASIAAGAGAAHESTTAPSLHAVAPLLAHAPVPQCVASVT